MRMQDYRNINCRCCCHVTTPSQTMYVLYRVTSAVCVLSANFSQTTQETNTKAQGQEIDSYTFVSLDLSFIFSAMKNLSFIN